jgi:RHS repeat-associated protein
MRKNQKNECLVANVIRSLLLLLMVCTLTNVAVAQTGAPAIFSSLSLPPTTMDAADGASAQIHVTGYVKAPGYGDAVSSVELLGKASYDEKSFPFVMSDDSENPRNVSQYFDLAASLPTGVNELFLRTHYFNRPYADAPIFKVTVNGLPAKNNAGYVSQSIPSQMVAGQVYRISIVMSNTGTSLWEPGLYLLGGLNDDTTWKQRVALPNGVPPGQSITFYFDVTAPAQPGTYSARWRMVQEHVEWFGDTTPATTINVVSSDPAVPTASISTPHMNDHFMATGTQAMIRVKGTAQSSPGATLKTLKLMEGNAVLKDSPDPAVFDMDVQLSTGPHKIYLLASDGVRESSHAEISIVIDPPGTSAGPAPTVSLTSIVDGQLYRSTGAGATLPIIGSASGNQAIKKIELFDKKTGASTAVLLKGINGSNVNFEQLFEVGTHAVELRATDVGDVAGSVFASFEVVSPPTVTLISPADGTTISSPTGASVPVTISATMVKKGGATIQKIEIIDNQMTIGAISLTGLDPTGTTPFSSVVQLAPGTHVLMLLIWDNVGNIIGSSSATMTIKPPVTNTAPTVNLLTPVNGSQFFIPTGKTIEVAVMGSAIDAEGGIDLIDLLDNDVVIATGTGASFNSTVMLAAGSHKLQLRAKDKQGLTALSPANNVGVSAARIAPFAEIKFLGTTTADQNYYIDRGSSILVFVSGRGVPGSAPIVRTELHDGAVTLASFNADEFRQRLDFTAGLHALQVWAIDADGRVGKSEIASLHVSTTSDDTISWDSVSVPTLPAVASASDSIVVSVGYGVHASEGSAIARLQLWDAETNTPLAMQTFPIRYSQSRPVDDPRSGTFSLALSGGYHRLFFRAFTAMSLYSDYEFSANIPVTSNKVPVAQFISPTPNSIFLAPSSGVANVNFQGIGIDADGAVTALELLEPSVSASLIAGIYGAAIDVNAPLAVGNHRIQLRATDHQKSTASAFADVTVISQKSGNAAQFISQNVPSIMQVGQTYFATVTMLNTGSTTWSPDIYWLASPIQQDGVRWNGTARALLSGPVAPGQAGIFTVEMTAPNTIGTFNFQWQMRKDGAIWFGDKSTSANVSVVYVRKPTAVLNAQSNNVRVATSQTAAVTFTGTGVEVGGVVKKLELFQDSMDAAGGGSKIVWSLATGNTASMAMNVSLNLPAGTYTFKLRATDNQGTYTDSSPIPVNVTDSLLLGTVAGVRINAASIPELVGWACQPGSMIPLSYQLLLDAPTTAAGGTPLTSGTANNATEPDNGAIQSLCGSAGVGHHFVINLASFTAQYPGRALYVRMTDSTWTYSTTLPCSDNSCTVPGSLRIALSTPSNGLSLDSASQVFMRTLLSGGSGPYDEVSLGVDGVWTPANPDGALDAFSLTSPLLVSRAAPYAIQARVRQGNITLYSMASMVTVRESLGMSVMLLSPANGATATSGVPVNLSAIIPGDSSSVISVKFYVNGQLVANGISNGSTWKASWNNVPVGTYSVTAVAFDGSGVQLAQSTAVTVTVSANNNSNDATLLAVKMTTPYVDNADAGTLPGELSVSPSGAAEYGIGLVVPPSTAGLAPELSLNYSSDGVNGLYGLGWSLGGLSSIHRCGKTIAQDGVNARINFDKGDRLCLDGARLVLISGTTMSDDAYWADDAVYRTEIESFMRIKAQGSGSARTFKVERKDGKVMTFGDASASVNARVLGYVALADGVRPKPEEVAARADAQSWAVDKIVDRSGNFITFQYVQSKTTGEHLIDAIRYGGNGLKPHAVVKFSYEDRTDSWTRYIDGTRHDLRQRATHIKTYAGADMSGDPVASALVRDYALSYETSPTSGRSLLKQVSVSAVNPVSGVTETLPATKFDWGKPDAGKTAGFVSKGMWAGAPILTTHANTGYKSASHPEYFAFQDFENHGLTDVLERRMASPADPQYNENPSTSANPVQPGTMQSQYRYFHNNGSGFSEYQYKLNTNESFVVLDLGDFDGDGAPDLLVATAGAGPKICLSPLRGGIGALSSPIVFTCASSSGRPAMGANVVNSGEYVVDVVGDGRSAIYGDIAASTHTASLYIQNEKLVDTEPPYAVLPYNDEDRRNTVSDTIQSFVSFDQMVDFAGIGKHADVRWTLPYVRPPATADNGEPIGSLTWVNLYPGIEITDFRKPGTARLGRIRSYALHDEYPAPDCVIQTNLPGNNSSVSCDPAPYRFDVPMPTGSAVADFSGSGYSNLMFGFVEINKLNSATRAEATLCLSTGRELDCGKLADHSGDQYKVVQAVGNFVGDGAPSVLMQETSRGTDTNGVKTVPVAVGPLQMCRLTGMGETPADARTSCAPWAGLSLPGPSSDAADQVYFMDLLGTGRTQAVYYHAGRWVGGAWQEDGRWEVLEPTDMAADGQALDRIYQVTNGLEAVSKVEYQDGLTDGLVSRAGQTDLTSSYPQRVALGAGKLVSKLKQANGVAGQHATSYRYFDPATDVAGRGTLGFGAVEARDEQSGIVITTSYSHVWPTKGLVRAVSMKTRDGLTLSETSNTPAYTPTNYPNGEHTYQSYVSKSVVDRHDLDKSDLGEVTTTNTYDDYGNLTKQKISSVADSQTFETEVVSVFQNDSSAWLIGLPMAVTTTRTNPVSGTLARKTTYEYDATTGLLTKATVQPGETQYEVVTEYLRPSKLFGVVEESKQTWTDPVTKATRTRSVKTGYDDKGRFATTVTNAENLTESYQYVAGTGARSQRTDANNLVTKWSTDGFGRVQKELRSDGNETRSYLKVCSGELCPERTDVAMVEITEQFHGDDRIAVPTLLFRDSVGHPLRSQTYAFNGDATYSDSSYDDRGRLILTSQPAYKTNTSPAMASSQEYDDLNRVVAVTVKDEAGTSQTTKTEYKGLTTVLTNPKSQVRTDVRNAIGQVVKVTDAMSGVTEFAYEPFGSLSKTTDPRKNVITVEYDKLGHKTALVDPDLGRVEYTVDPLGRVRKQSTKVQRDSSQSTEIDYDRLDRMTGRIESDLTAAWIYDTAANGKGQLGETYTGTDVNKDYRRVHTYDSQGRPVSTTQTLTDGAYTSEMVYDGWSRVVSQKYRRGTDPVKQFDLRYNDKGYLNWVERSGLKLWSVSKQDPANRPIEVALGNGLKQIQTYNTSSARLTGDQVKTSADVLRLDQGYTYDSLGSVSQRTQYWDQNGFIEDFTYDDLNRLASSTVSGQAAQSFKYYADGSLRSKTGVGSGDYVYPDPGVGAQRPHTVSSIPGFVSFSYDNNGNLLTAGNETVTWTSFDMPKLISKNEYSSGFVYGSEHQRVRQDRGDKLSIIYAGAQEVETQGTAVTVRTYWPMGIGFEVDSPGKPVQLIWTHKDRLGSPVALTAQDGTMLERLAYDAWGKRRSASGNSTADSIDGVTDHRGFTGHEMLDQLDLVHMNGRVYDPFTAKFLSGDPLIQDPMNGQNYNRYSYVLNNPTNLTDPTGFCDAPAGTRICAKDTTEVTDQNGNTKVVETKVLNAALKGTTLKIGSNGVLSDAKSPGANSDPSNRSANTTPAEPAFVTTHPDHFKDSVIGYDVPYHLDLLGEYFQQKQTETGNFIYGNLAQWTFGLNENLESGIMIAGTLKGNGVKGGGKLGVPGEEFVPAQNVSGPYSRPSGAGPTAEQRASVQGKPCAECGALSKNQVADHKDPLVVQHYREGKVNVEQQRQVDAVQPHCQTCSARQGGMLSNFSRAMKELFGF